MDVKKLFYNSRPITCCFISPVVGIDKLVVRPGEVLGTWILGQAKVDTCNSRINLVHKSIVHVISINVSVVGVAV